MKRSRALLIAIICLYSIVHYTPVWGQSISSNDVKVVKLFEKVEKDMRDDPAAIKTSLQRFLDYCNTTDNDTSAASGIGIIANYYIEKSNYFEAIRWYYYGIDSLCTDQGGKCIMMRRNLSKIYREIGDYENANLLLKENLKYFLEHDRKLGAAQEYGDIATVYLKDNQKDSARFYFEAALEYSRANNLFFNEVLSNNNLGYFHSSTGDLKLAEKYYLSGIRLLENRGSLNESQHRQLALLKGNLGGVYLDQNNPEKGIPLLEYDARINLESKDVDLGANASLRLADYYFSNKEFNKSLVTLQACLKHVTRIQNEHIVIRLYESIFKSYLELGDTRKAQYYYEIYSQKNKVLMESEEAEKLNIEKSLLSNILHTQLAYQKRELDLKERENQALNIENKYARLRLLVVIGLIVIFIVFGFIYFRKRVSVLKMTQQIAEQELKIERIEKEKVDAELKLKNKDLTDFAIDISRKQEILEELKEKLYELRNQKLDDLESKQKINELIQYTNNNLIVDTQIAEFQKNIEEVNYRFFDTLKHRFPELTELDKQVCGLIRLGLSNKEIAVMRNVSYKAVRMARYRLRKKMQLESEEDIVDFLKSI